MVLESLLSAVLVPSTPALGTVIELWSQTLTARVGQVYCEQYDYRDIFFKRKSHEASCLHKNFYGPPFLTHTDLFWSTLLLQSRSRNREAVTARLHLVGEYQSKTGLIGLGSGCCLSLVT